MNEQSRLQDLLEYQILDTNPEIELNELAEVACAVCGTPMSIISFIDGERQWYKAKVGLSNTEVKKEETFCQFTLDRPNELLIVENALEHEILKNNSSVKNAPFIRFYVGAPLVSPNGNVLGTLCVMNTEPMKISELQKRVLKILAKKTMDYLNARKLILAQKDVMEFSAEKLRKLTDQFPGVIYQFEISKEGIMKFDFISKGIAYLYPALNVELVKINPEIAFEFIHPEDIPQIKKSIQDSFLNLTELRTEYRVDSPDGQVHWHMGRAAPEKLDDGSVVWYGTLQEITNQKEYESAMEQIAFDISHILRRPVATLLGLTFIIHEEEKLDEAKLKEYTNYINIVSTELDNYTRKLNETYNLKRNIITGYRSSLPKAGQI
jgi:hypothetical protein